MLNCFDKPQLVQELLGISERIADPPAKVALGRAQQSIARVLLKVKYNYDWGLELEITEEECGDTEFLLQLRDNTSNGDRPLDWVLASVPRAIHTDYTVRYAIYSLFTEQHISVHILFVPSELEILWESEQRIRQLEYAPDAVANVLPMIRANPSIRFILFGHKRVAAARDHLWLDWCLDEGMTPAAIRDRWNGMSNEERLAVAPTSCDKIGGPNLDKAKALDVVKKSLSKAKKERAAEAE